jgi:hypothetical protein
MAQGTIKSIAVEVFDKETKEAKQAFLTLDLNTANALAVGSKFGSVGITDVKTEEITFGKGKDKTTALKVVDFKIPEVSKDAEASMSFRSINVGFKTKDGADYSIKKPISLEKAPEGQKGLVPKKSSTKFMADVAVVAKAGYLGNKGKTHEDKDFYNGTMEVFQESYYVNEKGDKVDEGTEGAEKRIYLERIDPREVKASIAFLTDLAAERKEAAPEADEPGR